MCKCEKCNRGTDESPALFSDGVFEYLPGMYCWECYHLEAIQKDIPCFRQCETGRNAGWTYRFTLVNAILDALQMTEDNIDQGIGIDPPIDGSYMSTFIIRNGQLYTRFADLREVREMKPEDQVAFIQGLLNRLDFKVVSPADSPPYCNGEGTGEGSHGPS